MLTIKNGKPLITVVGNFQNGKSTLLNCLLDAKYTQTGNGVRTTACCTYFCFGETETAKLVHGAADTSETLTRREEIFSPDFRYNPNDHLEISCWKPILQTANFADTPGFDANSEDDETANTAIREADIIMFVHEARQLDAKSIRILKVISSAGKKLFFLMNCTNQKHWMPSDENNRKIAEILEFQLKDIGFNLSLIHVKNQKVWPFNPLFAWYAMGHLQRELDYAHKSLQDEIENRIDEIEHFCKKQKWSAEQWKRNLLETSGILQIRKTLEEIALTPLNSVRRDFNLEIKQLTESWKNRMQAILKEEA